MNRTEVTSSNIASVGYNAHTCILEIEFCSGGIYQYQGVPAAAHAGLMQAESKGYYLNEYVKGSYVSKRIEDNEFSESGPLATARKINEVQDLYLQLMAHTHQNDLNGAHVAASLRNHPELWQAAIMASSFGLGMTLRDLREGDHSADTLFIVTDAGIGGVTLVKMAYQEWAASEVEIQVNSAIPGELQRLYGADISDCLDATKVVIAVWWD